MYSIQILALATGLFSSQTTAPSVVGHSHIHPGEPLEAGRHATNEARGAQRRADSPEFHDAIQLPDPMTGISIEGDYRVIRTNGIPNHVTGKFPNAGNPNAIRPREDVLRVPLAPVRLDDPIPARGAFGVAVNGIAFDAGTAEFWTPDGRRMGSAQDRPQGQRRPGTGERPERPSHRGRLGPSAQHRTGLQPEADGQAPRGERTEWNYEAIGGIIDLGIDLANAHVQPPGKYHYHGRPDELVKALLDGGETTHPVLVGWAADGYPTYVAGSARSASLEASPIAAWTSSYRLKSGTRPVSPEGPGGAFDGTFSADWEYQNGLGTLDEFNGRFDVTPEFPNGTYLYVITDQFPFVPRFWRGQPDPSFGRGGGGAGQEPRRPLRPH